MRRELEALGIAIAGSAWQRKMYMQFTEADRIAYDRVAERSKKGDEEATRQMVDHMEWMIHQPIPVESAEPLQGESAELPSPS